MAFVEAYPTFIPDPHAAPYLLADLDTIRLRQAGVTADRTLKFTIEDTAGQTYELTEVYTPSAEGVVEINDVRELLLPYFNLMDDQRLARFDETVLADYYLPVRLTIAEYVGSVLNWSETYTVVYSGVCTPYLHTLSTDLVQRFLQRESECRVVPDQPCSVSFWRGEGYTSLLVKMLCFDQGVPTLHTVEDNVTAQHTMYCHHFTLASLAGLIDVDVKDVIYADFQIFDTSGEKPVLRDSVRYINDRRHRAQERTFAFIGPMGEPEYVAMTGREQREAQFEGTFLLEHNDYRKAYTRLRKIHTSYTGPLSEAGRDLVWDMAASPWVYTIEDGALVEVAITEVELTDSSPHDQPIGLSVKWRYTGEYRQRTFTRKPNTPHVGVFDKTFDETFE